MPTGRHIGAGSTEGGTASESVCAVLDMSRRQLEEYSRKVRSYSLLLKNLISLKQSSQSVYDITTQYCTRTVEC